MPWAEDEVERQALQLADSHEIVVDNWQPWTWKKRSAIFASSFGLLWLLLEPVIAFSSAAWRLPKWGYVPLFLAAGAIAAASEWRTRALWVGTVQYVSFLVILTRSGRRVKVKAPADMEVRALVSDLLRELSRRAMIESTVVSLYENNLCVRRAHGYELVPNTLTLKEAGVGNGAECRIRGYIRIEYLIFRASHSWANYVAEVDEARKSGRVFLDEDVRQPVAKCSHRSGVADVYIVDNEGDDVARRTEQDRLLPLMQKLQGKGWSISPEAFQ